ncbi:MAG: Calx-beta domain-containing protein [Vicinamibacteria bacterium]
MRAIKVLGLLSVALLTGASETVAKGQGASTAGVRPSSGQAMARREPPLPEACFAPGTSPEVVRRYAQGRAALGERGLQTSLGGGSGRFQYDSGANWWGTATDGFVNNRPDGTPVTLTWNIVPDGTPIGKIGGIATESTGGSDLRAFLNSIYGNEAGWAPVFDRIFNEWGAINGVTYVRVNYDDGSQLSNANTGVLNVRADIRISGHFLDGPSNVLAYNFFPDFGDMVIDTGDTFYNNTLNNSQRMVNVLAHEHGHGLGLSHSCPIQQTKLMEPFVTTAFTGVQADDKLGSWRANGDDREKNETSATASDLGSLGNGTTNVEDVSLNSNADIDFYKFTVPTGKKASVTVIPTTLIPAPPIPGGTPTPVTSAYLAGPQNGDGSCSAGSSFDLRTVNDLAVELRNTNGTSILASANATGIGGTETIGATSLGGAGTFFVRVFSATANDNVQAYRLQITLSDDGSPTPTPTATPTPTLSIDDQAVGEGNSGTSIATFTVSLSAPSASTITVSWVTADNTATAASGDYVAASGSLTFTPGQTSKQIQVTINGDLLFESNETFFVNLSGASNAAIFDGQGQGTINNDDTQKPIVVTGSVSSIIDESVALNGTVNAQGLTTTMVFNYGPTIAYGTSTGVTNVGSGTTSAPWSVPAFNLTCATSYHFRISATNSAGTTNGADSTFTTATCPPPPTVTTVAATAIAQTGATLRGQVNPNGGTTSRRFQYGLTVGYGTTTPNVAIGNGSSGVDVSFVATGLSCATTYHFRAVGQNGGGTTNGPDQSVTTTACAVGPDNTVAARARAIAMNSEAGDSLSTSRSEVWYKVPLYASRSYQFSAFVVEDDGTAGVTAVDLALFSDAAGVTLATPSPTTTSGVLEGSSNLSPTFSQSTLFQPTASGQYLLRVLGQPAAGATAIRIVARETTLFSPWIFVTTASQYESYHTVHNNTSQAVAVTLRAVDATGTTLGNVTTFSIPANATVFKTTKGDLGVAPDALGGTILTHNGAFGAISANTTTLSGATGLSFDSPYTSRALQTIGLPVR